MLTHVEGQDVYNDHGITDGRELSHTVFTPLATDSKFD
jgi:hypothetical protein